MKTGIILNGKKAGLKCVRNAIAETRKNFPALEIRASYESGDVEPFTLLKEAY